jgi:hypothetical protein
MEMRLFEEVLDIKYHSRSESEVMVELIQLEMTCVYRPEQRHFK